MGTEWTDAQKHLFLELVREGKPTVEIARIMNRTKNALIGKAHRLIANRWPGFKEAWEAHSRNYASVIPSVEEKTKVKRLIPPREPKRFVHPPTTFVPDPEYFTPPPAEGIRIKDLTEYSCRFMVGDQLYCGEKIYKQSYCEHHYEATRIVKVI
jgi:hypothetical protein